jgi:hypothetical protein
MYVAKLRVRRQALGLDVPVDEVAAAAAQSGQQQHQQQQAVAVVATDAAGGGEDGEGPMEDGEGPMEDGECSGGGGAGSGSILASLKQQQGQDGNGGAPAGGGDEADVAVAAVLTGAVAGVVVRSAAAALPRDFALRRGMLETLARFDFPGMRALAESVYAGIEADFPQVRSFPEAHTGLHANVWGAAPLADRAPTSPHVEARAIKCGRHC